MKRLLGRAARWLWRSIYGGRKEKIAAAAIKVDFVVLVLLFRLTAMIDNEMNELREASACSVLGQCLIDQCLRNGQWPWLLCPVGHRVELVKLSTSVWLTVFSWCRSDCTLPTARRHLASSTVYLRALLILCYTTMFTVRNSHSNELVERNSSSSEWSDRWNKSFLMIRSLHGIVLNDKNLFKYHVAWS